MKRVACGIKCVLSEPRGSRQALINLLSLLFPFGKHYLPLPAQYVLGDHSAVSAGAFKSGLQPWQEPVQHPWDGRGGQAGLAQHHLSNTSSRAGEPGTYLGRAGRSNVIAQVFVSLEKTGLKLPGILVSTSSLSRKCVKQAHVTYFCSQAASCALLRHISTTFWLEILKFYSAFIFPASGGHLPAEGSLVGGDLAALFSSQRRINPAGCNPGCSLSSPHFSREKGTKKLSSLLAASCLHKRGGENAVWRSGSDRDQPIKLRK